MKTIEMDVNSTYVECPDKKCRSWYDERVDCEVDCPYKEKMIKLKKCFNCGDIIKLSLDHSKMDRLEHKCASGVTPFMLEGQTIITRYRLKELNKI